MKVHLIHHISTEEVCCDLTMSTTHIVYLESDVKSKTEKSDKKRPGYCECCGVRFDDFALVSNIDPFRHQCIMLHFSLACQGGPTHGICNKPGQFCTTGCNV